MSKERRKIIKIGLIDDHVLFRAGARMLLETKGKYSVTIEAENGLELVKKMRRVDTKDLPDLVLLDINMPEMDGFETVRWLKVNHPGIKIVVLTMSDIEVKVIKMLQLGADAYILKDLKPTQLFHAIDTTLVKGIFHPKWVADIVSAYIKVDKNTAAWKIKEIRKLFSEKEIQILKLLSKDLSTQEISSKTSISVRTVEGVILRLIKQLGLKSRLGLIMYAYRNGIVDLTMLESRPGSGSKNRRY